MPPIAGDNIKSNSLNDILIFSAKELQIFAAFIWFT